MKNGAFELTHQGIAFYEDGCLADGQHRLSAIVKSGVTVQMMVARGIEKGRAIDRNRPRSIADCAKIAGHAWVDKSVIGAVNAMYSLTGTSKKFTVDECITLAEKHKPALTYVGNLLGQKVKGLSQSGVYAAMVMALENGVSESSISRFYTVLKTGFADENNERIIIKLRDHLMFKAINTGGHTARKDIVLRTQRAIKAFVTGEIISRLISPDEVIYKV
jgi:hypothetical protein